MDEHGLHFLSHQAGTSLTVDELQASLEIRARSWLSGKYKRQVTSLREAKGSADTFIFDGYMMCCGQDERTRKLELYSLDPAAEDPVSDESICTLKIGEEGNLGPSGVECYDTNQDLVIFVHTRGSK